MKCTTNLIEHSYDDCDDGRFTDDKDERPHGPAHTSVFSAKTSMPRVGLGLYAPCGGFGVYRAIGFAIRAFFVRGLGLLGLVGLFLAVGMATTRFLRVHIYSPA